jgi:hypothetical protein
MKPLVLKRPLATITQENLRNKQMPQKWIQVLAMARTKVSEAKSRLLISKNASLGNEKSAIREKRLHFDMNIFDFMSLAVLTPPTA